MFLVALSEYDQLLVESDSEVCPFLCYWTLLQPWSLKGYLELVIKFVLMGVNINITTGLQVEFLSWYFEPYNQSYPESC